MIEANTEINAQISKITIHSSLSDLETTFERFSRDLLDDNGQEQGII